VVKGQINKKKYIRILHRKLTYYTDAETINKVSFRVTSPLSMYYLSPPDWSYLFLLSFDTNCFLWSLVIGGLWKKGNWRGRREGAGGGGRGEGGNMSLVPLLTILAALQSL
jgi:hypothetical protein